MSYAERGSNEDEERDDEDRDEGGSGMKGGNSVSQSIALGMLLLVVEEEAIEGAAGIPSEVMARGS